MTELFARALIASCCLASVTGAAAQSLEEIARCRSIADDARRLGCYDAIQLSPAAPRSKYEPVVFADLQAYALSYRGRLVEVAGWIRPQGNYYVIGSAADDTRALPIDLQVLTRQMRDELATRCPAGCEAIIQGRVGPVNFVTGIVAETVLVR